MKYRLYLFLMVYALLFSGCQWDDEQTVWKTGGPLTVTEYTNAGDYNMILVPVPSGGVTFPVSVNDYDDSTSKIDNAYYMGETEVTIGLWYVIADWATYKKEGEKYRNIFFNKHKYYPLHEMEYSISDVNYIQTLIWCNAYTEWHNFQYGTDYVPVYVDETGKPVRSAIKPMNPDFFKNGSTPFSSETSRIRQLYNLLNDYLDANETMKGYLNNVETYGNGFRLPTPDEWELAARWEGYDDEGVLRFKSGALLSNPVDLWEGTKATMLPSTYFTKPKTYSNDLGLYEMSGNLREYVYYTTYILLMSAYDHPFAQTRGGSFLDNGTTLTISYKMYVDATSYNYYYGFRVARNADE